MPKVTIASKQSQRADTPVFLCEPSREEFSDDAPQARLMERIVVEYARAWRGAHGRAEDPQAAGTC